MYIYLHLPDFDFDFLRSGGVMIYFDRIEVVNMLVPSAGTGCSDFIFLLQKFLVSLTSVMTETLLLSLYELPGYYLSLCKDCDSGLCLCVVGVWVCLRDFFSSSFWDKAFSFLCSFVFIQIGAVVTVKSFFLMHYCLQL